MRLLLLEPSPDVESIIAARLAAAGHDVARCFDEVSGGPCRGVADDRRCPLHDPVDLTVVVRAPGSPALLSETGAVCSERRRVPVTLVDPTDLDGLGERVERAAAAGQDRREAACARQVRSALADDHAGVEVHRRATQVLVTVTLPWTPDARQRSRVADRARAAVRAHDPFVTVIDVAVVDRAAEPSPTGDPDRDAEWFVDDGDELFGSAAPLGARAWPR